MLDRKKAPPGYYSAREAIAKIGISTQAFYQLVEREVIPRVYIKEKAREGVYPIYIVDAYAKNRQQKIVRGALGSFEFGVALAEDLPTIFNLVSSVSGGPNHAVPVEILKAWIRKNPQSIHVLRRQNEVIGYVSGFLLPMETLSKRLDGTLLNREIPIDDIQPFDANKNAAFYVAEMAVKPSRRSIEEGHPIPDDFLGAVLIKYMAAFLLHDLKKQGVMIQEIYAVGSSPFGISLCQKLGMFPLSFSKGVREDRVPCKLRVAKSPLLARFLQMLERAA